jgi:hypothetical protein
MLGDAVVTLLLATTNVVVEGVEFEDVEWSGPLETTTPVDGSAGARVEGEAGVTARAFGAAEAAGAGSPPTGREIW